MALPSIHRVITNPLPNSSAKRHPALTSYHETEEWTIISKAIKQRSKPILSRLLTNSEYINNKMLTYTCEGDISDFVKDLLTDILTALGLIGESEKCTGEV